MVKTVNAVSCWLVHAQRIHVQIFEAKNTTVFVTTLSWQFILLTSLSPVLRGKALILENTATDRVLALSPHLPHSSAVFKLGGTEQVYTQYNMVLWKHTEASQRAADECVLGQVRSS